MARDLLYNTNTKNYQRLTDTTGDYGQLNTNPGHSGQIKYENENLTKQLHQHFAVQN